MKFGLDECIPFA